MKRRSRTRRLLKWAGTLLCVLVAAAFCLSLKYTLIVDVRQDLGVAQRAGIVIIKWPHGQMPARGSLRVEAFDASGPDGWPRVFWWPKYSVPRDLGPQPLESSVGRFVPGYADIPHWLVLLLLAIPTALLWWSDRRRREGCCEACGYDLTGNVSGRCPECGQPVGPVAERTNASG